MKVWIVEWWSTSYENGIMGAFSTEELAKKWMEDNPPKTRNVSGYTCEGWPVDTVQEES